MSRVKAVWEYLPRWMGPFIPAIKTFLMGVAGAAAGAAIDAAILLARQGNPVLWSAAGLEHVGHAALVAGLAAIGGYLRPQPQQRKEWSEEEREAHRQKLVTQGRLPK